MTHWCTSKLCYHWIIQWLVACSAPSHYLNQCWIIVQKTLGNKTLQWNFNRNSNIFIEENAFKTLLWRHNGRDDVSNHQPHDCLLNRSFRRRSKKTSKLRVTGFVSPVNSPLKWPVTRKMFPFDDVFMNGSEMAAILSRPQNVEMTGYASTHRRISYFSSKTLSVFNMKADNKTGQYV